MGPETNGSRLYRRHVRARRDGECQLSHLLAQSRIGLSCVQRYAIRRAEAMPKNIVVFSDGTGQDGGVRPEQRVSNIYKMYRASRVSFDNDVDPAKQVTMYDPGLGTDLGST